ncbi:MAG: shikimate kinase [Opitutaceae bacterium]|jgi:shikimate kinase|nr:shikimate kinase [Opitutaceae bacterium]
MQTPDANLYLVGFMGTGKSTVGRAVAARLGFQALDSDAQIERAQGRPVAEIFAADGEPAFRVMEREFVENGHPASRCVVACGGGLVVQPGMLGLLKKRGVVVCLHASVETILERTRAHTHRPLLNVENPLERIRALHAEREAVYRNAGTLVLTDGRTLADVIGHVMRIYRRDGVEFCRARDGSAAGGGAHGAGGGRFTE